MLAREWRSGELGVLLLALTVAVAALTGVGFLVSRISIAVAMQASEVLAADIRLGSPQTIGKEYVEEAGRRRLQTATNTALLSVVFNGDASQLTNVHAVTAGYPLRGQVLIANEPFGHGTPASGIPAPGEVWPDSKLFAALGARIGSSFSIGAATFRVTHVLISRPDQGGAFADLAPTLLMNASDLPATQLIQPGSGANDCGISLMPVHRSRTRWIARAVSSAWRAWLVCCCARLPWQCRRGATWHGISTRWLF
jgi:putative ABC transport system permease protein